MAGKIEKMKSEWRRIKTSSQFHNALMFLVFVAIAAVFWFIIALNENIMETFRVRIAIHNVPDSVTFINDPPSEMHVTVRDKGTNILRSGVMKHPKVELNWSDYARDGVFRVSRADLTNELKSDLGGAVQISAISVDSLRCLYTDSRGRRVPVMVQADVDAASGYIIQGNPVSLQRTVSVYSYGDEADTVKFVTTQRLVKSDLSQTSEFEARLLPLKNVKIVPSSVKVQVKVEPLVHKEALVPVEVLNQPEGINLLLFPNRVPVSFYVPMSHFNDTEFPMHVVADYKETLHTGGSKISVRLKSHSPSLVNVMLKSDSVDYTLVKQ